MKTDTARGAVAREALAAPVPAFQRIVAALDIDPVRSEVVVRAVEQLARATGGDVLVVHVQELERPAVIAGTPRPGALAPAAPFGTAHEAKVMVDTTVERLRATGIVAEGVVEPAEGSTARELLRIANDFGATVIVVGDRGSRVTDLLLGSVAHKIVRDAGCSVLLAR